MSSPSPNERHDSPPPSRPSPSSLLTQTPTPILQNPKDLLVVDRTRRRPRARNTQRNTAIFIIAFVLLVSTLNELRCIKLECVTRAGRYRGIEHSKEEEEQEGGRRAGNGNGNANWGRSYVGGGAVVGAPPPSTYSSARKKTSAGNTVSAEVKRENVKSRTMHGPLSRKLREKEREVYSARDGKHDILDAESTTTGLPGGKPIRDDVSEQFDYIGAGARGGESLYDDSMTVGGIDWWGYEGAT